MKWMRNRFVLLTYAALLTVLAAIGCTSKEDPSEVLEICGNHSCGELVMVTSDTSSDGFHYLNPAMSPDGSRIIFTADWWAIPTDPRYDGDAVFVNRRQMIVMPVREGLGPAQTLVDQGAELIYIWEFNIPNLGGAPLYINQDAGNAPDLDKSGPIWQDDTHILFSMELLVGNRLFRTDVSNPDRAEPELLYLEPTDALASPVSWQHLEPTLSPDGRWLAFTRSGCVIPDSFETCSGLELWALDMTTAGLDDGYGVTARPLTNEYSRIETPEWSPDGRKLVFAGGMDLDGGRGSGTELYTIDFDSTGFGAGQQIVDNNLTRLTYTRINAGDPISGVLNSSPVYSPDMSTIYFVSTRRSPSITLHDRNIWRIPADGSLEPEIHYFTRADDVDPQINPDGSMLLSSAVGFPTEMLNRLEEEAYQTFAAEDTLGLDEVLLRALAADERRQLEFFEGVMFHVYLYRP